MEILFKQQVALGRTAFVGCTAKGDGDLSMSTVDVHELAQRRSGIKNLPWSVCRQVHSDRIIAGTVDTPPAVADAVMVTTGGQVAAVHSADCVPVAFVHHGGAVAAAHAGWRGLERGVLESAARALHSHGAGRIEAVIGPHIRTASYQFGEAPLTRLAARFGPAVRGTTTSGSPALDLRAAVLGELARLGVAIAVASPDCTAANADHYWSYRARRETGRFALLTWMTDD